MLIELNGSLCDYCKNCPYMELVVVANSITGKFYACENRGLCAQLWEHLKRATMDD